MRHAEQGRRNLPLHATDHFADLPTAPVRLPGLDPDKVYEVSPLDVSLDLIKQDITNGQSPLGWWNPEGVKMTGRALETYAFARRPSTPLRPSCSRSWKSDGLKLLNGFFRRLRRADCRIEDDRWSAVRFGGSRFA